MSQDLTLRSYMELSSSHPDPQIFSAEQLGRIVGTQFETAIDLLASRYSSLLRICRDRNVPPPALIGSESELLALDPLLLRLDENSPIHDSLRPIRFEHLVRSAAPDLMGFVTMPGNGHPVTVIAPSVIQRLCDPTLRRNIPVAPRHSVLYSPAPFELSIDQRKAIADLTSHHHDWIQELALIKNGLARQSEQLCLIVPRVDAPFGEDELDRRLKECARSLQRIVGRTKTFFVANITMKPDVVRFLPQFPVRGL
jgi:hypothetical protein